MMDNATIVKAWKDPSFRATLSAEQLAELPANPSGVAMSELNESELSEVVGGMPPVSHANSCGYICTLTTECGCY